MEESHRRRLSEAAPELADRVYLLSEMVGQRDLGHLSQREQAATLVVGVSLLNPPVVVEIPSPVG